MAEDPRDESERRAQASAEAKGAGAAARDLLQRERLGVLATLSARKPGWPAPSLAPYALSARGEPLLLISALAQHTRNLEADPRACLFVQDLAAAASDPRTAPRVAVYGRAQPVLPGEEPDARARYLARHPEARGLLGLDFTLWVIDVEEAQWVGGFAAAGWIPRAELLAPP
jgi:putative heme iron utilization protein